MCDLSTESGRKGRMQVIYFDRNLDSWQTERLCPNGCGTFVIAWNETNGPDDYKEVWYCDECEEQFDE